MKTTYSLLFAATLFCLTVISVPQVHAQSTNQVAVVEIIFGFHGPEDVSGIYVSYPDGKTEQVELLGDMGKENIQKNGVTIAKTLQKFFKDGWSLSSSCGGDNSKRYIFTK